MNAESTPSQIREQIQSVMAVIEQATEAMADGETVNLRNLERLVNDLHQAVARRPADGAGMSATDIINSFTAILTGLDDLETLLNADQARRVGAAYGRKIERC